MITTSRSTKPRDRFNSLPGGVWENTAIDQALSEESLVS